MSRATPPGSKGCQGRGTTDSPSAPWTAMWGSVPFLHGSWQLRITQVAVRGGGGGGVQTAVHGAFVITVAPAQPGQVTELLITTSFLREGSLWT